MNSGASAIAAAPAKRFCRSCRYSLAGLSAGPCPECGAHFDPADPSSFSNGQLCRGLLAIVVAIGLAPWLTHAAGWMAFLAARIELGRSPRMWVDDPKVVPGPPLADLPLALLALCSCGAPLVLFGSIVLAVRGLRPDQRWNAAAAGLVILSWTAAGALLFATRSPWDWLID